jgi:hypothetical protein
MFWEIRLRVVGCKQAQRILRCGHVRRQFDFDIAVKVP